MVHSAQEVEMIASNKPGKPRSKPSPSYGSPAKEPIVREPPDQSGDYGKKVEPILLGPPQEPTPEYGPAGAHSKPREPDPAPEYGSAHQDPGYGQSPPDPPPGYGSNPRGPERSYGSDPYRPRPPHIPPVLPPGQPPHLPSGYAAAYPFLTREIDGLSSRSLDPSAVAGGDGSLGSTVTRALQKALCWKPKSDFDPTGFVNALNQSFSLKEVEGVIQWKWTPRTSVPQSDFMGGLAGAQASIHTMASTILDQALPLIDGFWALNPVSDAEYATVLRQTAASQLRSVVDELGRRGGPRLLRVNHFFLALAGIPIDANGNLPPDQDEFWIDPDRIGGTVGLLRDELGLGAVTSSFVNNVADEQNVTNFRVFVDYINAIFNSWRNSLQFFTAMDSPFLGTQLVWLSRLLGVVNEAVEELQFVLDSVFIGPAERETLLMTGLMDGAGQPLPSITLEELLTMVQSLATQDGARIIEIGGRYGIGDLSQMVRQLENYVFAAIGFAESLDQKYSAISTDRVVVALYKLQKQLDELQATAARVGTSSLPPQDAPTNRAQS
jgi:hypothetical protein